MAKNDATTSDKPELMDHEDSRPTPANVQPLVEMPGYITEAIGRRKGEVSED